MNAKIIIRYLLIVILIGFGLITLFLSTSVIFDIFGIRAKEGNYVLFVVWSNFISSILYLFAAFGLIKVKKWASVLLGLSAIILLVSFIFLKLHISNGGIYETKTVGAMIFRTSLTVVFTVASYFTTRRDKVIGL